MCWQSIIAPGRSGSPSSRYNQPTPHSRPRRDIPAGVGCVLFEEIPRLCGGSLFFCIAAECPTFPFLVSGTCIDRDIRPYGNDKAVCIRMPERFLGRDSVSPLGARRKRLTGLLEHDKLYHPYPHTVVRKSETPGASAPRRLAERSCRSKAAAGTRRHPVLPTTDTEEPWRCISIETRLPSGAVYRRRRDRLGGRRATIVTFCFVRSSFIKNRENLLTLNPK